MKFEPRKSEDGNFVFRESKDIKFAEKGSDAWYLYHSIKNENALIPVIIFSFITLFLNEGWVISLCIWIGYFIYCHNNNEALNKDPRILRERELAKEAYRKSIECLKRMEENNGNKK